MGVVEKREKGRGFPRQQLIESHALAVRIAGSTANRVPSTTKNSFSLGSVWWKNLCAWVVDLVLIIV